MIDHFWNNPLCIRLHLLLECPSAFEYKQSESHKRDKLFCAVVVTEYTSAVDNFTIWQTGGMKKKKTTAIATWKYLVRRNKKKKKRKKK